MLKTKVLAMGEVESNLPAFNQTIEIKVDVDSIYKKMMDTLPEDYKHKEILAHAIVGSAVRNGGIGYIYNALNGFTNDIDFRVGDQVICTAEERTEGYDANLEDVYGTPLKREFAEAVSEYKPNWKTRQVAIGKCVVKEVDMYGENKLIVTFDNWNHYDKKNKPYDMAVDHKKCTRVSMYPEPVAH